MYLEPCVIWLGHSQVILLGLGIGKALSLFSQSCMVCVERNSEIFYSSIMYGQQRSQLL